LTRGHFFEHWFSDERPRAQVDSAEASLVIQALQSFLPPFSGDHPPALNILSVEAFPESVIQA
jgi:hypothetical protein